MTQLKKLSHATDSRDVALTARLSAPTSLHHILRAFWLWLTLGVSDKVLP
jgi:hypothetical protein